MSKRSKDGCGVCGDRFQAHVGDCCGRCQQMVCRACSRKRGRWHESVLCVSCYGAPKPAGFRATFFFRAWRRMLAG